MLDTILMNSVHSIQSQFAVFNCDLYDTFLTGAFLLIVPQNLCQEELPIEGEMP